MLEELESLLKPSLVCFYMQSIFLALTEMWLHKYIKFYYWKLFPFLIQVIKQVIRFLETNLFVLIVMRPWLRSLTKDHTHFTFYVDSCPDAELNDQNVQIQIEYGGFTVKFVYLSRFFHINGQVVTINLKGFWKWQKKTIIKPTL